MGIRSALRQSMLARWKEQPGSWHAHIAGIMRRVVDITEEPRYRRSLVGEVRVLKEIGEADCRTALVSRLMQCIDKE